MVVDGCGWLWVVFWVLVDGCGCLSVVVDSCGWLRMVVGGCWWLWVVVYFSITRIKISFNFDTCKVDCMFLSCHIRFSEWIHTLLLPECQGTLCKKQAGNLKFKWLQLDSISEPLARTRVDPRSQIPLTRTWTRSQIPEPDRRTKWLSIRLRTKWFWDRVHLQGRFRSDSSISEFQNLLQYGMFSLKVE